MLFILSSVIHILKVLGRKERKQWQTWQSTYDMCTANGYNYIKSMQRTKYSLHAVKTHHYLAERPKQNVGLFAIIRPGEILFSSTRRRKLSTFYFFPIHMKDLLILTINYSWPRYSFYAIKHCTIRALLLLLFKGLGGQLLKYGLIRTERHCGIR